MECIFLVAPEWNEYQSDVEYLEDLSSLVKESLMLLHDDGNLFVIINDRMWGWQADCQDIDEIGAARRSLHKDHESSMPMSEENERVGLAGEQLVGKIFGKRIDDSEKIMGDEGIDFLFRSGTVDVKTARKPIWLLLEKDHEPVADIMIMCGYNDDTRMAYVLGWEYGIVMKEQPLRDNAGVNKIFHYKLSTELHHIDELMKYEGVFDNYANMSMIPQRLAEEFNGVYLSKHGEEILETKTGVAYICKNSRVPEIDLGKKLHTFEDIMQKTTKALDSVTILGYNNTWSEFVESCDRQQRFVETRL